MTKKILMIDKDLLMDLSDQMENLQTAIRRYYDNEDNFTSDDLLNVVCGVDMGVWSVMQDMKAKQLIPMLEETPDE